MPRALGITVKSGWAAAVVVEQAGKEGRALESRLVELCDPKLPESKQPYHDGFATMRQPGAVLTKLLEAVHRAGAESVTALLRDVQSRGRISGVGVVVGSLIDPTTIGNEHIRIHAMEGQLFRGVVSEAVDACGLRSTVFRERDLPKAPITIKRPATGPWRKEQKNAALAAWLVVQRKS